MFHFCKRDPVFCHIQPVVLTFHFFAGAAMAGRWDCAGQRLGAHYTDETGVGLAVVRAARTCRISSDPVENGARAVDLEGKRHELGAR